MMDVVSQVNGCGFFQWHDEDVSVRVKNLLNELKYDKLMLLKENRKLRAQINGGSSSVEEDIDVVWRELKKLKKEQEKEVDSCKKKMITTYIACSLSWIIIVIVIYLHMM